MNFWKFLIALICGVAVWLIIENPYANFVEGKRKMEESQQIEKFDSDYETPDVNVNELKVLKEIDTPNFINSKSKFDLYLPNCKSKKVEIELIKTILKVDEMQAEIFSDSKNDTIPLLINLDFESAKIYAEAFKNAGCRVRLRTSN